MAYSFKKFLNTLRGERIDQPDFRYGVETSQLHAQAQLASAVLTGGLSGAGAQNPRTFIIGGFIASGNALDLTITAGQALLSARIDGQIVEGLVYTKDPSTSSKTISLASLPDGTYNAYVRFELLEDEYTNRPFWNADGAPPAEIARIIPTRLAEGWSIAVEITAPGSEWTHVAQVVKAAGVLTVSDRRTMYYEGRAIASPAWSPNEDWGDGALDRNASRGNNGIGGMRTFVRAVQRQLQDIIHGSTVPGSEGWFSAVTLGLSDMLALDGSRQMTGSILPDASNAYDLGSGPNSWRDGFFSRDLVVGDDLDISDQLTVGGATQISGTLTAQAAANLQGVTTASGTLITSALLDTQAGVGLGGIVTATPLAANVDNYNPGITGASILRVSSSAAVQITGLLAPSFDQLLVMINVGANAITLMAENLSSSPANRFAATGAASTQALLGPSEAIQLFYDAGLARWVLIGATPGLAVA